MNDVYLDADIITWHSRGLMQAGRLLTALASDPGVRLCMPAIQWAEVIFFFRPHEQRLVDGLSQVISITPVTKEIVGRAVLLYQRWQPSHALSMNDAILAATVIKAGGKLYTQNIRHFPMPELDVELGWE